MSSVRALRPDLATGRVDEDAETFGAATRRATTTCGPSSQVAEHLLPAKKQNGGRPRPVDVGAYEADARLIGGRGARAADQGRIT
jgi:hypothetical protein